ncbi:G-type lectin S-receptor-like serine/threonine-protein kinase B120 [Rosa rugosa]|uniref:G-type lectin S-receptor-like serine/threonine-protein kinase B120 n=1 Tax=Rosa rugosa TaxID=74645 RepID=UPI002B411DF8|nr:G-type lectin S-receptor-like serine/threonine-protein kinase B120 [Rosa rugosa]
MGELFLYLVTFLLYVIFPFCSSQDNLVPEKSINANQTLTSSIETFALGFFSPEHSTNYFLGIWYNTVPNTAIIWVANRESPLASPGVFTLGDDGDLVVLDEARKVKVWSSNVPVSAAARNGTTSLLMDTGNLVLRFGGDALWESSDHPSDTMLPGMKISLNKKTGQQRRFTSWAELHDPQPGKFILGIDPKRSWTAFYLEGKCFLCVKDPGGSLKRSLVIAVVQQQQG